jgi:F-type H+-transporting ATPase subunit gamma
MAQTQVIQRRIRSVKNAKQLTKALEVVAASRMRRVLESVARSRTYGDIATQIMQRIAGVQEAKNHRYFAPASDRPSLYVVITSDRGQAGAFNSNIFNLALTEFKADKHRPQVIVFGRKGSRYFAGLEGIELIAAYEDVADIPEVNVFAPVLEAIKTGMESGKIGSVKIISTHFLSSLNQKAELFKLLPIDLSMVETSQKTTTVYEFEPEIEEVLAEAIRLYFEAKFMQSKIESAASEHAMRMMAMGNANRNASDLIDDLTLELNATRQAAITQEIAEITGGVAAIAD